MMVNNALAARIREYVVELDLVVERAVRFSKQAAKSGEDAYWDAVALNLHGYYSGVERIFEDIARTMDASLPEGSDWHQRLLFQMSAEIQGVRPAVIDRETRACLDEFRAFRHIVRNVYAFNFRPQRLQELADSLRDCYAAVQHDLTGFSEFLEKLDL
jgi:hypothetical protein